MNGLSRFKINIFDLRMPSGFVFFSFSGLVIYMAISYLTLYPITKSTLECAFDLVGLKSASACQFDSRWFSFSGLFFVGVAFATKTFTPNDYSADALFNNASILLVFTTPVTVVLYLGGYVYILQQSSPLLFAVIALCIVSVFTLLATIHQGFDGFKNEKKRLLFAILTYYFLVIWTFNVGLYYVMNF